MVTIEAAQLLFFLMSTPLSPLARLRREDTVLMIVDVQERLVPAMFEAERVLRYCSTLARAAQEMDIPVFVSEQNPDKLGNTSEALLRVLEKPTVVSKMLFSACTEETLDFLRKSGRSTVVLCGLETHICVLQTALDLVENGFTVFLPQDAVSSRYESDKRAGLERMRLAGVVPSTSEAAIFELMREAGTPEFKALLPFIK